MKKLFLAVLVVLVCASGGWAEGYRNRGPVRMPRPYGGYGAYQRGFASGYQSSLYTQSWTQMPNWPYGTATFYRDSSGNYGSSVWVGSTRFDSYQQVRPAPVSPWWW